MADTSSGLLLRVRDGTDGEAWARLVHLYAPLLHGWLHRYAVPAEDADDVVQDVLLAAVREMPDFRYDRSRGSFRGWLRIVLVHRLRDHQRSRRHQSLIAKGEALLHRLEDPHDDLARTWDREHDEHVIGRLLQVVRLDFDGRTWEAFRRARPWRGSPLPPWPSPLG